MAEGILGSMSVRLGAEISDFQKKMRQVNRDFAGVIQAGEGMKDVGQSLSTYVTAPLAALAAVSLKAAGDLQALKKGLASVTGSAAEAEKEFSALKEVAKLPGLGLEEAVQGSINLQAAGFSAEQARSSLAGFGNALATVGKGKAELSGVITALTQMASKGKISSEEINQIAERVPQIRKIMKDAFGTSASEDLQKMGVSAEEFVYKVTNELNKLPKVTGGINNAFENLADTGKSALASMGDAINKAFNFEGLLNRFSDAIAGVVSWFQELSPSAQRMIVVIGGVAAAAGPLLLVVGSIGAAIPAIVAGFAALAGPIGIAVAGFAALAVGIGSAVASSKTAKQAYDEQKASVANLTSTMTPLLARYEELKSKTNLNKAEQKELRDIIEKVGRTVPGAITEFDRYGKAMGLNTQVAKEFIKSQQRIAEIKNKEVLTEQREEYTRLTKEINSATAALEKRQAFIKTMTSQQKKDREGLGIDDSGDLLRMADTLAGLKEARKGVGAYIDELKGIPPAAKEVAEEVQKSFDRNPIVAKVKVEKIGKVDELESQIAEEIKNIKPDSLDTFSIDTLLNPPKFGALGGDVAPTLPNGLGEFPAQLEKSKNAWQIFQEDIMAGSQSIQEVLAGGLSGAFDVLGTAIAGVASGDVNFFANLEKAVKDFAKTFGQFLIKWGIGAILTSNPLGAAAIVAGGALVAFGGAGGKGASPSVGSSGRYSGQSGASGPRSTAMSAPSAGANSAVEFKIRGTELVGVLRQQGHKDGR